MAIRKLLKVKIIRKKEKLKYSFVFDIMGILRIIWKLFFNKLNEITVILNSNILCQGNNSLYLEWI